MEGSVEEHKMASGQTLAENGNEDPYVEEFRGMYIGCDRYK